MSILTTLKEQLGSEPLSSASQIVVAYSGGVDSHVLLHALDKIRNQQSLPFQLSAIHIHHGLSQHADQWQNHCEQICRSLDVAFQTVNVNLVDAPRQSLEAQAREARYNQLTELAPANSQVLLGQHQDDQLETFLLQLKRGAGPKGLSAMNRSWIVSGSTGSGKYVGFYRPLLDVTQQQILEYARHHNLQWCEDESNQNTDFERNFLRHDVLPVLQNRWPEIARSVARSASLCAEQQSLLDEINEDKLKSLRASANSLHLSGLKQLSQPWLHQLIRYWLAELGIQNPSLAMLRQLKPELLDAADDATPILQWQDWQFRRFNQQLFVINVPPERVSFGMQWQGEKRVNLPYNQGSLSFLTVKTLTTNLKSQFNIDPSLGSVEIRLGGYGIKFKPLGSAYSKPVKQWFKEWKVAPWVRESAVFVVQNEVVLALLIQGQWYLSQATESLSSETSIVSVTFDSDAH
ncbi:MAG: tRNA lysidine(34) synthetase TilS [Paraglaciecola sp.]|uniref:tRNA lysidine(34) synthetase TilS n=1 Tax=Paraglaciecola sp. TaxID=1920173 RepID=UPI00329707FE